jgi:hypothetical protein
MLHDTKVYAGSKLSNPPLEQQLYTQDCFKYSFLIARVEVNESSKLI